MQGATPNPIALEPLGKFLGEKDVCKLGLAVAFPGRTVVAVDRIGCGEGEVDAFLDVGGEVVATRGDLDDANGRGRVLRRWHEI